MSKHEPMTAKAIGIRIKAKGLQKIKYYCQICEKQFRDDNGFKCHISSEAHNRKALIVFDDPNRVVEQNSKEFSDTFMHILKTRYKTKKILANSVFQEQIKDRDHTHLNGTRWTSLTEFCQWLGAQGLVETEDSERGIMITYVDRDPEVIRRQELEARRAQRAKELASKRDDDIIRQREATKRLYEEQQAVIETNKRDEGEPSELSFQPISLKPITTATSYRPPKRKLRKIKAK